MNSRISPMLAHLGSKKDLEKPGWIYEPKLDGTRALYYSKNKNLINKVGGNLNYKYPELSFEKNIICKDCILDGEIIIYDLDGNPDFNLMQKREHNQKKEFIDYLSKNYPATFVVFDILKKMGNC